MSMRERFARALAVSTLALLVVAAVAFARGQNPEAPARAPTSESAGPNDPAETPVAEARQVADSIRGRGVFEEQGCTRCHSAAGIGSPRLPLDDVGARRTPESLRAWTTGDPALADSLAPSTLRRKQGYALTDADLAALVAFLASLKAAP